MSSIGTLPFADLGFPRRGMPTPKGEKEPIILVFPQKLHVIEKKIVQEEDARS